MKATIEQKVVTETVTEVEAEVTVENIMAAFPTVYNANAGDKPDDAVCVGGAFLRFIGIEGESFPSLSVLERKSLLFIGIQRISDLPRRYIAAVTTACSGIIHSNDQGEFGAAYDHLGTLIKVLEELDSIRRA